MNPFIPWSLSVFFVFFSCFNSNSFLLQWWSSQSLEKQGDFEEKSEAGVELENLFTCLEIPCLVAENCSVYLHVIEKSSFIFLILLNSNVSLDLSDSILHLRMPWHRWLTEPNCLPVMMSSAACMMRAMVGFLSDRTWGPCLISMISRTKKQQLPYQSSSSCPCGIQSANGTMAGQPTPVYVSPQNKALIRAY